MRVIVLSDYGHVSGGAAQVAISSLNGPAAAGLDVIFVSSVGPRRSGYQARQGSCRQFWIARSA
jgi:hypothetical protein